MAEQEISIGTLYDVNKNIMSNQSKLKKHDIKDKIRELAKHFENSSHRYYMLLCKERADYTLFNDTSDLLLRYSSFTHDLYECLTNRGEVLSIERANDQVAYEIWLKIGEEAFVYYFFPYDNGVIEVLDV